jgi:hypothetical protein
MKKTISKASEADAVRWIQEYVEIREDICGKLVYCLRSKEISKEIDVADIFKTKHEKNFRKVIKEVKDILDKIG